MINLYYIIRQNNEVWFISASSKRKAYRNFTNLGIKTDIDKIKKISIKTFRNKKPMCLNPCVSMQNSELSDGKAIIFRHGDDGQLVITPCNIESCVKMISFGDRNFTSDDPYLPMYFYDQYKLQIRLNDDFTEDFLNEIYEKLKNFLTNHKFHDLFDES